MPTDPPVTETHPIQRFAYLGVVVLGAIIGLSTIPGIWITAFGYEGWALSPQYLVAGFEALTLAAGIAAVLIGLRRNPDGIGIGLLCIAGTVFVGAVLGSMVLQSSSDQVPSLRNFVLLRLGLVMGIAGLAGLIKLGTRSDCWRTLVIGSALLLPIMTIGGLVVTRKVARVIEPIGQLGEVLQLVIWLLIAIVVGIMTIAGGHLVIRAFEKTRESGVKAGELNPE